MSKIMTAQEAIELIQDGMTMAVEGFVGCAHPEELSIALEEKFLKQNSPKDLTLIYAAGQGDGKDKGLNHLGHPGLLKRVIGGHWNLSPKVQKLAMDEQIAAYNFPQGVISHWFRDIAAKRPGTITHVGLKTFVDPRVTGGKLNAVTKEDLVELITIDGQEFLRYKPLKIDIALIRGTYADEKGNLTMEKECCTLNATSIAQAAKNSGGKVIVQVEQVVQNGSLDPRLVKVPGIYVDAIVVAQPENHMQTFGTRFDPSMCGESKIPVGDIKPMDFDNRKIISRRAAMELVPHGVINLGIGMPEGVSKVAFEEGLAEHLNLTVESGPIGGAPESGVNFGGSINPEAILDQTAQFDFYDGGGIDVAFLGLAECDTKGNINVSKFGTRIAGCGGFIDITQNAKKVIYCGTFTAGGLKCAVKDGKMTIENEGKAKKFIQEVGHITFSGDYARQKNQPVLYVTERAVFSLEEEGLTLIEIAPGIDLEKDILAQMDFKPIISKDLKLMDERIFREEKMGLTL